MTSARRILIAGIAVLLFAPLLSAQPPHIMVTIDTHDPGTPFPHFWE